MTMFVRERQAPGTPTGVVRADGENIGGPALHPATAPGPDGETRTESTRGGAVMTAVRVVLLMVGVVAIGVALNLVLVSHLEQKTAQFKEISQLRYQFAAETGPVSPVQDHKPLPLGTPMAVLTIPSIGVKEVVDEGTTSQVLLAGPGHLPSTVFPGGLGTSVIYGRAGSYGGPFARISQLHKGDRILVTIQDGPVNTAVFRVADIRIAGQKIPPIGHGGARLTLVTAKESMFVPSGAIYVDADIVGSALPTYRPVVKSSAIPADELPLGVDTGSLWLLFLWICVLAVAVAASLWTWRQKGLVRAWIIFIGPVALIGYFLVNQISILLPNLT
jgi:LPXTG-site transpeptidase (sortase) family protein